jgi:probable rRNA maturation factor
MLPQQISILSRQRAVAIRVNALQDFATAALAESLKVPGNRKLDVLGQLEEVSIILVSDRRIAELHRRFLEEAGPTDVITFHHGDIVISVETARRQARAFGTSLDRELCLYIAHGLLHLRGFDDKTAAGAAEMKRVQERLVDRALRRSMAKIAS